MILTTLLGLNMDKYVPFILLIPATAMLWERERDSQPARQTDTRMVGQKEVKETNYVKEKNSQTDLSPFQNSTVRQIDTLLGETAKDEKEARFHFHSVLTSLEICFQSTHSKERAATNHRQRGW